MAHIHHGKQHEPVKRMSSRPSLNMDKAGTIILGKSVTWTKPNTDVFLPQAGTEQGEHLDTGVEHHT